MKFETRRLISFMIALLTLCAAVMASGCAGETGTPEETTAAVTVLQTEAAPEPAETEDPYFKCELDPEAIDYKGEEISILAAGQNFSADEFYAENVTGSTVNDAVYKRNLDIEQELGVTLQIKLAPGSSVYETGDEIRKIVAAGDQTYDIATMPGYTHTAYVLEGDFTNLYDVPNLDLNKGYWTQGFNIIMSNGVKQYVASGAYSISMIRMMYITLYNKDLAKDHGLPDLYQLAVDGDWTLEKQAEIIKGTYSDLNGSGTADSSDFYGFISGLNTSADPYWVALELPVMVLDRTTNQYSLDLNVDKFADAVTSIHNLINKNPDSYCVGTSGGDVDGSYSTLIPSLFAKEQCIICTTTVYNLETTLTQSNFTGDYGIVPMPKYNADQQDYHTHVQDQLSVIGLVSTVPENDVPMVGSVMEYLTAKSYESVFPAYYENALSYRYLQNAESKTMLDLIYNSIRIEGVFIYSSKFAMLGKFRSIVAGGTGASAIIKSNMKVWQKSCTELNEQLAALGK